MTRSVVLLTVVAMAVAGCGDGQNAARTPPIAQAGAEAPATGLADASSLIARFGLREADVPERDRPGWAPPRRIVVHGLDAWAEPLRAVAPGVVIVAAPTPDSAARLLGEADVYVGLCTPAILDQGSTLKWIHLWSAGTDPCAGLLAASGRAIALTHSPGLNAPEVAEHALAFMLSLARHLHTYRDEQARTEWSHPPSDARAITSRGFWEVDGKHLLVVGLGNVGTELARRAHALGMRVRATRNSTREGPDFVEYVGLANELSTLAPWADVVVNTTPLTADTRGMFNAAFFAIMKPSAYFINVGRGESVVTEDLVAALRANRIAGAALDVTDPEPLPGDHPLWTMPNVILTPHIAAGSDLVLDRGLALAAENVRRYTRGDRLLAVVEVR
jgi:phosphoglycerate dehydrogenase-like enzyme